MLIANKQAVKDPRRRKRSRTYSCCFDGALAAETKVGLKMNVPEKALKSVLSILPALQKPTIARLSDESWVDVDTIVDEKMVRELIPDLKRAGATGIVEYPAQ